RPGLHGLHLSRPVLGAPDQPRARAQLTETRTRPDPRGSGRVLVASSDGGVLAALRLRLGDAHEPHLDRAHRGVPAEALLHAVAELFARLLLDAVRQDDHVA